MNKNICIKKSKYKYVFRQINRSIAFHIGVLYHRVEK